MINRFVTDNQVFETNVRCYDNIMKKFNSWDFNQCKPKGMFNCLYCVHENYYQVSEK